MQYCCATLLLSRNKRQVGSRWLKSLTNFKLCAATANNRMCQQTQHVTSVVGSCWPTMLCPFARGFIKSSTTRVRTFLKPHIFCPYPGVDGPLNHSVSALTGFVWTKGRIRVKLYAVSKISGCFGKWPYFVSFVV